MCLHRCDAVEIAGLLEPCSAGIHREAVAIKKMCPDALVESTQALTGHIEAETLRRLGENIEERANEAMDDDVASSVDLIEPPWADVQRIEAEINATDGDPDEALEKRFSEADERLWVRSRHAFNAAGGSPRANFCPSPARGNASHRPQTKLAFPMEVVH
jgi:hypothetical protein